MDERIQKQGDLVQKMLAGGIADIDDYFGDNLVEEMNSKGADAAGDAAGDVPENTAVPVRTSPRRAGKRQRKEVSEVSVVCLHLRLPKDLKIELQVCAVRAGMSMNDYIMGLVKRDIARNRK